jgi:hypothetical protein
MLASPRCFAALNMTPKAARVTFQSQSTSKEHDREAIERNHAYGFFYQPV